MLGWIVVCLAASNVRLRRPRERWRGADEHAIGPVFTLDPFIALPGAQVAGPIDEHEATVSADVDQPDDDTDDDSTGDDDDSTGDDDDSTGDEGARPDGSPDGAEVQA